MKCLCHTPEETCTKPATLTLHSQMGQAVHSIGKKTRHCAYPWQTFTLQVQMCDEGPPSYLSTCRGLA